MSEIETIAEIRETEKLKKGEEDKEGVGQEEGWSPERYVEFPRSKGTRRKEEVGDGENGRGNERRRGWDL